MKVGVISDTHGYLDPKVFHYFKDCNEVWHAGDVGKCCPLRDFRKFSNPCEPSLVI